MQPTLNSIPFLYAAYILVFAAQVGYAAWVGVRWSRMKRIR